MQRLARWCLLRHNVLHRRIEDDLWSRCGGFVRYTNHTRVLLAFRIRQSKAYQNDFDQQSIVAFCHQYDAFLLSVASSVLPCLEYVRDFCGTWHLFSNIWTTVVTSAYFLIEAGSRCIVGIPAESRLSVWQLIVLSPFALTDRNSRHWSVCLP